MGRKKIQMTLIAEDRKRQNCYLKRKRGLIKKVMEINQLTDVKVCISLYDPHRKTLTSYMSDGFKSQEILQGVERFEEFITGKAFDADDTVKKSPQIFVADEIQRLVAQGHLQVAEHEKAKPRVQTFWNRLCTQDFIDDETESPTINQSKDGESNVNELNVVKIDEPNQVNKVNSTVNNACRNGCEPDTLADCAEVNKQRPSRKSLQPAGDGTALITGDDVHLKTSGEFEPTLGKRPRPPEAEESGTGRCKFESVLDSASRTTKRPKFSDEAIAAYSQLAQSDPASADTSSADPKPPEQIRRQGMSFEFLQNEEHTFHDLNLANPYIAIFEQLEALESLFLKQAWNGHEDFQGGTQPLPLELIPETIDDFVQHSMLGMLSPSVVTKKSDALNNLSIINGLKQCLLQMNQLCILVD